MSSICLHIYPTFHEEEAVFVFLIALSPGPDALPGDWGSSVTWEDE